MNKKILLIGIVLLILANFVLADIADDLNNGAVLYYKLEESGFNYDDAVGTLDMTLGTSPTQQAGIINNGQNYIYNNGDYTSTANSEALELSYPVISAWFNSPSLTGDVELSFIGTSEFDTNRKGFGCIISVSTGKLSCRGGDGAGNQETITYDTVISTSTNYHVFTWFDGTDVNLCINGQAVSTTTSGSISSIGYSSGTNTQFLIGEQGHITSRYFNGLVDEVYYGDFGNSISDCSYANFLYNGGAPSTNQQYPFVFTGDQPTQYIAFNNYTNTSIANFNLNITNSSGTYSLSTTNGSIYSPKDDLVNLTFYSSEHHKKTYENINSSLINIYNGEIGETNVKIVLQNGIGEPVGSDFEWNITDITNTTKVLFQTSTGNFTSSPPSTNVTYNIKDNQSAFIEINSSIIFPSLGTGEYNLTVQYKPIELEFVSATDLSAIVDANITVYFPGGETNVYTTDGDGLIEVPLIYNSKIQLGEYTFTFGSYGGFESPVNFSRNITQNNLPYSEQIGITSAGISVNIYDRETKALLTGVPVDIIILGILNKTTTTGIVNIIDETFVAGDYTIQAYADGYITEQQLITFTGTENETLDIYLLNATGENTALMFANVIDEFYRVQPNARVSLFEYNTNTKAYEKVSEKLSNVNGEAVFAIELNVKSYYLSATKTIDGEIFTAETNTEIFQTENEVRNMILKQIKFPTIQPNDYVVFNYLYDTFMNNISTIFMDFYTTDNFVTTICVEYFLVANYAESSIYQQCIQSSSAYVATPVLLNRSNDYVARVYQNTSGTIYYFKTFNYYKITSANEIFDADNLTVYIILFLWVALIVLTLKSENMMFLLVLGLILSWSELAWFPSVKTVAGTISKTAIIIVMFFVARKKEDLA